MSKFSSLELAKDEENLATKPLPAQILPSAKIVAGTQFCSYSVFASLSFIDKIGMSRIGRKPIIIPQEIEVKICGQKVTVKGPKGEINRTLPEKIKATLDKDKLLVLPLGKEKKTTAVWGLWRALIANMIEGVHHGFEKRLELEGVGFRAEVKGDKLALSVGFSHPIEIEKPPGIDFKLEKNVIIVSGVDKQLVGQVAARIRAKRKPEPYKGTGIRYEGEVIKRKAGKKAVTTELEK